MKLAARRHGCKFAPNLTICECENSENIAPVISPLEYTVLTHHPQVNITLYSFSSHIVSKFHHQVL